MRKLTISEKKNVNAGAASMMGIATGILTVTGVFNLVFDLINRYFGGKSRGAQLSLPSCDGALESCLKNHSELLVIPEELENRISIYQEQKKDSSMLENVGLTY